MIIQGIWYDDDLRSFRLKRAFIEMVSVAANSLTKNELTTRPTLYFTAKERKEAQAVPVTWPTSFPWENKKQEASDQKSPYWSVQMKDKFTKKFDAEYVFRSNMPITTTAVAGGTWEAAAAGWIYNRYLKKRVHRSALSAASKANPYAVGGALYAGGVALAVHDMGVVFDTMPDRGLGYRLEMMIAGFKMPGGSSLGSAVS